MSTPEQRTTSFPDYQPTTPNFLAHLTATHGDRVLVVADQQRLTYREAEAESRSMARGLLARGVDKGTRIGLLAPNGPEWIVGWLAAARIGAVVVPVNTYLKPRELSRTLRHADVAILLTVDRVLGIDFLDRFEESVTGLERQAHGRLRTVSQPALREVWVWGDTSRGWCAPIADLVSSDATAEVSDAVLDALGDDVSPADPMAIMYSSGSTSEPKGAVHTQGSVIRHAHNLWQFRDLRAGDAIYTPMPLFWVGGLSYTLVAAMHAGATVVYEQRFEPSATLTLIERERCTHVIGWPHMMKALIEDPTLAARDLSSVRSPGLRPAQAADPAVDPALRPNALGMTETLGPHTLEQEGSMLSAHQSGSFGRSVPGVEHKIVDPLTGVEVRSDEMGELAIRGYSVMQGLNKLEREQVFDTDGWYHTGDGGRIDADGHLYFLGRLGDVIKSAGMNITPREVELVIEEQAGVLHAFVMGIDHPDRGEDVAAVVVAQFGCTVEAGAVIAAARAELSSYKVPRHVMIVGDQSELPWLESGKIDRRAVRRILAEYCATTAESTAQAD